MRRTWVTIATAVLLVPRSASSQAAGVAVGIGYGVLSVASLVRLMERTVSVGLGDNVQVRRQRGDDVRGRLTHVGLDSIIISDSAGLHAIRRADVLKLQRYDGKELKWAQGWGYGFLIGAATGAVAGYADGNDNPNSHDFFIFSRTDKAVILGVVGAVSGSVIGAAVGVLSDGDHLRDTYPLPVQIGVVPMRSRVLMGVNVGF